MTSSSVRNVSVTAFDEPSLGLFGFCARSGERHALAAGGIRVVSEGSPEGMKNMAIELAESMALKCLVSGLPCDGLKVVIREPPSEKRQDAFRFLGEWIESFNGELQTAGDLGTRAKDLSAVEKGTQWVHRNTASLSKAVSRTILSTASIARKYAVDSGDTPLYVVQGVGDIGGSLASALIEEGHEVLIWDVDAKLAASVGEKLRCSWVSEVDVSTFKRAWVWMPCAIGHQVRQGMLFETPPLFVAGGANCIIENGDAAADFFDRGIPCVPAVFSSAGAIIEGIGGRILQRDCEEFYKTLEENCRSVFVESRRLKISPWHLIHRIQKALDR